MNFVRCAINELFMVRIVALGGDCDVSYRRRLAHIHVRNSPVNHVVVYNETRGHISRN